MEARICRQAIRFSLILCWSLSLAGCTLIGHQPATKLSPKTPLETKAPKNQDPRGSLISATGSANPSDQKDLVLQPVDPASVWAAADRTKKETSSTAKSVPINKTPPKQVIRGTVAEVDEPTPDRLEPHLPTFADPPMVPFFEKPSEVGLSEPPPKLETPAPEQVDQKMFDELAAQIIRSVPPSTKIKLTFSTIRNRRPQVHRLSTGEIVVSNGIFPLLKAKQELAGLLAITAAELILETESAGNNSAKPIDSREVDQRAKQLLSQAKLSGEPTEARRQLAAWNATPPAFPASFTPLAGN